MFDGQSNVIYLLILAAFAIVGGIVNLSGRGIRIALGYSISAENLKKYDQPKVCRYSGAVYIIIAALCLAEAAWQYWQLPEAFTATIVFMVAVVAVALFQVIYIRVAKRFKLPEYRS